MAVINDDRNKQKFSMAQIPPELDKETNSQVGIDYGHHQVHNGTHFEITNVWADVADTSPGLGLAFYMPDTSSDLVHLQFRVSSSGLARVQFIEDAAVATVSNGFVAIDLDSTPYNNRRVSSNTAEMLIGASSSTSLGDGNLPVNGTVIWESFVGGAGGFFVGTSPGGQNRDTEFILKQHETAEMGFSQSCYLLRLIPISDGIYVSMGLDWYEHEGIA